MGRIRELINIFINPVQREKSLEELVPEDVGMNPSDLDLLKKSANGVEGNWKFVDDVEEPKKRKHSQVTTSKETSIQQEPKNVAKEQKADFERD